MKVLLVNGSPHEYGCTHTALAEVAKGLTEQGVEAEHFWIGNQPISGCIGCGACRRSGTGTCVFDDTVNEFIARIGEYDGFVFGSPVHYAAISGGMTSFMDRVFYVASSKLRGKPGAGVVSARRGGTTAALDQLNKYFYISGMPIPTSQYWAMVHGNSPEQVAEDKEGLQIMRTLGRNMAWMLRCIEAGKAAGITPPDPEPMERTNFIR